VTPLTTLEEAADVMARHAVRRLPVVLDDRVVGVLSEHDLALHTPPGRTGSLLRRIAAAPSDRPSGAWLLRRAYPAA
jgi:CBS domain-containing protein